MNSVNRFLRKHHKISVHSHLVCFDYRFTLVLRGIYKFFCAIAVIKLSLLITF